ncbi:hypothetical protein H8S23_13640 [Anaerofilum sp. BX8]|uniref:Uncharacterized protein n=1 Tax=Anaerofilum hominis TaxID=2763016 RepID=A0A923L2A3_9FIRM|nr:hypothetical protein [Anaerofilum hominis]MBC5582550.1 hypothetical protein [Anaerofilum hominis]
MPIKLNNATFNNGGTAKFNNTSLSAIRYGSTEVWKKQTTLYHYGDTGSSITGGWTPTVTGTNAGSLASASAAGTYLYTKAENNTSAQFRTNRAIDLTPYKKLYFICTGNISPTGWIAVFLDASDAWNASQRYIIESSVSNYTGVWDISGISGSHVVGVCARTGWPGRSEITWFSVTLE